MKTAIIASCLGLAMGSAVHATPILFSYTTGGLGQGTLADSIVKSASGETVTATAWSLTGNSDTTLQTAALGQYTGLGLGVCNQVELKGSCGAPQHEVDDNGQFDFVLFTFSSPVTSVSITINPVCNCDTDASYYVGNGINPLGSTLAALGAATTSDETTKDVTRTINLTGLGSGVTSVLFGASILGNDNYFKIQSLSVTEATVTPEPATFGIAGLALIGVGMIRRKAGKSVTQ